MKIQEVIDRVLTDSTGETRIAPTCDQLMTGDPQQEVKGIAVTFMATVEVIREAAAKGVNFIITHEPTWFTGRDVPDWCAEDSTYLAKRRLIDETGMTIWRYHDHMHAAAGDRIYWGVADKLGWNQYLVPGQKAPWLYEIPQTTLVDLAADLKRKLDMTTLQTIGDPEMPVNKVLILVGGGSLGLGVEEMPMQAMQQTHADVMLCGDVTEWTTCAYIRDAMQLGQNKAMIKLGHERSEEAGMEYMATWLPDLIDHCCPVIFIDAKEPFVYL